MTSGSAVRVCLGQDGDIAQSAEHLAVNQRVEGSSPSISALVSKKSQKTKKAFMEKLNSACEEVTKRLRSHDIFYDAFVSTVESGIKDFLRTNKNGSYRSYRDMAEYIVKRISGEC